MLVTRRLVRENCSLTDTLFSRHRLLVPGTFFPQLHFSHSFSYSELFEISFADESNEDEENILYLLKTTIFNKQRMLNIVPSSAINVNRNKFSSPPYNNITSSVAFPLLPLPSC